MGKESKKITNIIKWAFVIIILFIIFMVFKDSYKDILRELLKLSFITLILLFAVSIIYNFFDGLAYYMHGKRHNKDFKIIDGILCSYYCGFFRLATLGGGTAVAGIYYLRNKKIDEVSSGSFITINYMIQKIAVLFNFLLLFFINFSKMKKNYGEYIKYIYLGILFTFIIVSVLLAVCLSKNMHMVLMGIIRFFDKKKRLDKYIIIADEKLTKLRKDTLTYIKDKKLLLKLFMINSLKFILGWNLIGAVFIGSGSMSDIIFYEGVSSVAIALAGVIPAPGGAGSTEFLFYSLYSIITTKAIAGGIMVLYRVFTYFVPFIFGGIYIFILKLINKNTAGR